MQPTIIEDIISVAGASTVANIIVSNPSLRGLLNAPLPSKIILSCVQSAAGLLVDALHGGAMYASAVEPRVATAMETPNDVINGGAFCQAQEQMVLRVTNTVGGALTFSYRLELIPMVDESWDGNPVELPPDAVVMQAARAIPAGSVDLQLLDGLMFEQLAPPAILKVLMSAAAAGLTRSLFIDQDRIAPPSAVAPTNRIPTDPFDTTINGVEVPPNAKQYIAMNNATGGPIVVNWKTIAQKLVRD